MSTKSGEMMVRTERNPQKRPVPSKGLLLREMTPTSARVKVGGHFRVQGQGYQKTDSEKLAEGAEAASSAAMSSEWDKYDMEGDEDATNPLLVDELVGINRTLEKQIETLRLRMEFDTRHHEAQKSSILVETSHRLKTKAEEISILKSQVSEKDSKIHTLSEKNHKRDSEIADLRRQIESLNNDVESAKTYANDLVTDLATLTKEKEMYESMGLEGGNNTGINTLRKEVSGLKKNLSTLERELSKAREVITSQTGQIKFMESDKKSIQLKFKEELAKVSQSMRLEVEKMRDVMIKQWSEMRSLREQNVSMSKDIKDIRSLLVNGCLDDEAKLQQQQQQVQHIPHPPIQQHPQPEGHGHMVQQVAVPPPTSVPQTARGGKNVYNKYSIDPLKPSLPVLHKDTKKQSQRKK